MPLSISLSPIEELSSEELEPLKDALLAYLRSQNAAIRDQVDQNLHITRGERVPAYSFHLLSLLETRDSVPTKMLKPCGTDVEKNFPSAGVAPPDPQKAGFDIWSFPSEVREEFVSHAGTYFIPGTTHIDDCRECFQKGEMGCKACMGKGMESCSACLGAGRQTCVFCKGSEKISCLRCGGEGRLASGEVGGRSATCDACGSTGKFPCHHCKTGKVSCSQCSGGGNAPCQKCKGQGKISCAACGGQKKVISGLAFQATFRSFQVRGSALLESGPKEALEMALETTKDGGALPVLDGEPLGLQVNEAVVPSSIRTVLTEIIEREKAQESPSTRVVKRRLEMVEGSVVRITGYCSGQEFSFWILPGTNRIIAEKDPMAAFGMTAASSAEEARDAGDWKKALALARESLAYSPGHAGARHIINVWRRKVVGEALLAGVSGGFLSAVGHVVWIGFYVKGLHKAGALLHAVGVSLLLGPLVGLLLLPLLLRIPRFLPRVSLLGSGLLVVFFFSAMAGRWSTSANPVQMADQLALEKALNDHFKYGFPQVYFEPDLRFLQALLDKYKNTQVDLNRLNEAVAFQVSLKAKLGGHQREFETKIREVLYSGGSAGRKRADLTKLANQYRLMGVDMTPLETALEKLPVAEKHGNTQRFHPTSRMRISSSPPAKPAGRVPLKKNKSTKATKPLTKKVETNKPNLKTGSSNRWWE